MHGEIRLAVGPLVHRAKRQALLAHVLVSKYADHLPLYRQSQTFGPDGINLERSTLADWVERSLVLNPWRMRQAVMCRPDR